MEIFFERFHISLFVFALVATAFFLLVRAYGSYRERRDDGQSWIRSALLAFPSAVASLFADSAIAKIEESRHHERPPALSSERGSAWMEYVEEDVDVKAGEAAKFETKRNNPWGVFGFWFSVLLGLKFAGPFLVSLLRGRMNEGVPEDLAPVLMIGTVLLQAGAITVWTARDRDRIVEEIEAERRQAAELAWLKARNSAAPEAPFFIEGANEHPGD